MKRVSILSAILLAAALQGSALNDCGRLYMVGDATPAGWTVWHPYALDWTARGVYVYEGGLTKGELKFTNEVGVWGTIFAPGENVTIGQTGVSEPGLSASATNDRKWQVEKEGRYRLTVDVRNETIEAEYLGELPKAIYMLGDAVDEWDSLKGHPVYQRPDGKYVYQTWMFNQGGGGKAFKFTLDLEEWQKATFIVPDIATDNGFINYIEPGTHYMKTATDGNGPIDSFWGVQHDNVMRIVVDLDNMNFQAEKVYRSFGLDGSHANQPAPMYWMAYEQCFVTDLSLSEARYDKSVKWVAENFREAGYEMVSTDGWVESSQSINKYGYITKYSSEWKKNMRGMVDFCEDHGLLAGFYFNPLWMSRTAYEAECKVYGTDGIRCSAIAGSEKFNSLLYWVDTDKEGAEQWVKGFVRHIINNGFKFLRVDFLNMYENAYGTDRYRKAIRWMQEEARDEIWLSLVMPNCWGHAEAEQQYGDLFRISEDCFTGGFDFVSDRRRGQRYEGWANWGNLFDGFVDFSDVPRQSIIMDGDFVRLNTCNSDNERYFWISLLVMAGSPIAISDQYDSPGVDGFKHMYTNDRIISLAREGFYAKPLSRDVNDKDRSSIWVGTAANGDCVVGFFNRENQRRQFSWTFNDGPGDVYTNDLTDLWTGQQIPDFKNEMSVTLKPHACQIFRFHPGAVTGVSDAAAQGRTALQAACLEGTLTLTAAAPLGRVAVYTPGGALVASIRTDELHAELPLDVAAGLYIVTTDCGSAKVIAK